MHRPWQEVDVQEGGLTPILCGCLSLGPPSDLPIATLLQAFGAWEMVPALVTIRMTTWLTLNDSTHSALLTSPCSGDMCRQTVQCCCPMTPAYPKDLITPYM